MQKKIKILLIASVAALVAIIAYLDYQKRAYDNFIGPRLPSTIEEQMRLRGDL